MRRFPVTLVGIGIIVLVIVLIGSRFWKVVQPGHVAVATIFGDVKMEPFEEGLHIPVNPLYVWYDYDVRNKTHFEKANVPSQDQLTTEVDVSVQYHVRRTDAPLILKGTGSIERVRDVHLIPKIRSLLREQGKSVIRAEDFFQETTQNRLQTSLHAGLHEYLTPRGVEVDAVLIRDIRLPPFITKAIEEKKEREQEVEKQKAELERYSTEQQQKVAAAQAERQAAEEQAVRIKVLAEAQAYEIEQINQAIGSNPAYVKLKALEALQSISKDPAAKVYFLNGDSANPLPLLHMGENP